MPAYMCLTITGQEEFEMHLTVLAVPGCPNVALLEEQLASVLDGRPGVTVSRHVIAEEAEAASWGMHGSPTILINGADPFAEPGPVSQHVLPPVRGQRWPDFWCAVSGPAPPGHRAGRGE